MLARSIYRGNPENFSLYRWPPSRFVGFEPLKSIDRNGFSISIYISNMVAHPTPWRCCHPNLCPFTPPPDRRDTLTVTSLNGGYAGDKPPDPTPVSAANRRERRPDALRPPGGWAVTPETSRAADTSDYEEMLDTLDAAIDEAQRKIEEGRVRDEGKERVRIKWVRALAYAVNVRRQVTNDRDLETLADEIEEIREKQQREKVRA